MKKQLITTVIVLSSISAWASPIDWAQAEVLATRFCRQGALQQATPAWQRVKRQGMAAPAHAPYYVFNRDDGHGFVIVAGDDAAQPILGYSDEGTFSYDNMPPALRAWLDLNERYVAACSQCAPVRHTAPQGTPVVEPLLGDILWGQGSPYNEQCPTYTSSGVTTHYYVGCVATAATQIMRYHQYPEHGIGSKSLTVGGVQYTADFGNTTYDWTNMLPSYEGVESTSAQRTAVATLAAHMGIAVDMEYQPAGSGAHSMVVPGALRDYFGYDHATTMRKRDYYTSDEWLGIICAELDAGRPVYYAAASEVGSSGHAFVCDGYDTEGFVHINWGWSGKSNGYFLINHLDPDDLGIGGGTGGYNLDQEIITGMQRPTQGTTYERPLYNGLSMRLLSQDNATFGVMVTVENFDTKPFAGELGVALVRDGQVLSVLKSEQCNIAGFANGRTGLLMMKSIYDIPKTVGSDIVDGEAQVWMAFREDASAPWQPMRYCRARDSRNKPYVGYFPTTVAAGKILTLDDSGSHPDVTLLNALAPQGKVYAQGTALFDLEMRNNSDDVRLKNIVIRFTSVDDASQVFDYENPVNVYDASVERRQLLVNLADTMPQGNYRLTAFEKGFEQYPFEQTMGDGLVEVLPQAATPVMRLTTAVQWRRADGEMTACQGDNVYFALNTRNYGSPGNVGVILNLVDVNDSTKAYVYQQSNATVSQGEDKTLTFYRKLPVDPGTYRVMITYATDDGRITPDDNNDRYPLTITIGQAGNIMLNAVDIDLPDWVVKGERLTGSVTLAAPSDFSGTVYVRMRQYTLTNGGLLYMGNQQIAAGESKTISISSTINFEPGRYLIMVEAKRSGVEGTIGDYANCYKLIDVVTEPPVFLGDVNGDGAVDVGDVNIIVNIMLGKDDAGNYPGADVTGDGPIDVGDVNQVINIMLGKN